MAGHIYAKLLMLMLGFFLSMSDPLQAQTLEDPSLDDPANVPVDGGLSILIAAGAAYSVGRLRRRSPKQR